MAQLKADIRTLAPDSKWTGLPVHLVVGYDFIEHCVAKLCRGPDVFIGIPTQFCVLFPSLADGWRWSWKFSEASPSCSASRLRVRISSLSGFETDLLYLVLFAMLVLGMYGAVRRRQSPSRQA
jgi:hypothetical protein